MSAKSSNFAAEMIKNMQLNTITHTQWRCRHSLYATKGVVCTQQARFCTEDECSTCPLWKPSHIAEDFFNNKLDPCLHNIVYGIFKDREKRGEW